MNLTGGINTDITSIARDVAAGQVINGVHAKIDSVLPDEILSPVGEVYKSMLMSGSAGVVNRGVDNFKN